jgi:hypothetical protein
MKPALWIAVVLLAAILLFARNVARDAVLPKVTPAPEAVITDVQLGSRLPENNLILGLALMGAVPIGAILDSVEWRAPN